MVTDTPQDAVLLARAELMGRFLRLEDLLNELPNSVYTIDDCNRALDKLLVKAEALRLALYGLSQAGGE